MYKSFIMKKLIPVIFALLSLYSYSQERVNKILPQIAIPAKAQLNTAKGWRQQPDGQWMGRNNRIPVEVDSGTKALVDYETWGVGTDNFVYLRLHKLTYEGRRYIILIKNSKSGYYRYESIQEGWVDTHNYYYVVFDENDFLNAFSDIKTGALNFIEVGIKQIGYKMFGKESTALKDIASEISKDGLNEDKYKFVFRIAPFKEKNLVQFLFYDETITGYPTFGMLYLLGTSFKQSELDSIYFETNYSAFNSFITLP